VWLLSTIENGCSAAITTIGGIFLGWLLTVLSGRWSERRLFDHRVRLEKEYALYSDLWDKLFELRRTIGTVLAQHTTPDELPRDDEVTGWFNAFQAVVRKGEPFMSMSVYTPARDIAALAREIITNLGKIRAIDKDEDATHPRRNSELEENRIDRKLQLEEENETSFEMLEQLYQQVSHAIRVRTTAP
jgi:hypothetical protein